MSKKISVAVAFFLLSTILHHLIMMLQHKMEFLNGDFTSTWLEIIRFTMN